MSRPDYLYLPSTPRHLLLCAALALRAPDARHHLYMVEHHAASSVDRYLEVLSRWPGSPFATVERLEADYRRRMNPHIPRALRPVARIGTKRRLRSENRRRIGEAIRRLQPARIYVGSDDFFETQLALHLNRSRNAGACGIYVEDGTVAYQATFKDRGLPRLLGVRRFKAWGKKLSFGRWFEYVPVTGMSSYIDEAWLAFPQLAVEELRNKRLRQLPTDLFAGGAFAELGAQLVRRFNAPLVELADAEVLIALTRSTTAKVMPGYVATIYRLIDLLVARGLRVVVKHHPREFAQDFIVLRPSPQICI